MAFERKFGIADDTEPGGSDYDTLTTGIVPVATELWPVTTANVDRNQSNIDRNADVGGHRANKPPVPFRQDPRVPIGGLAYPNLLKRLTRRALGSAETKTGTPPAAITHKFAPIDYGSDVLPGLHATVVRDGVMHKVAGCTVNRLALDLPLDGDGTFEAELWGLYQVPSSGAGPAVSQVAVGDEVFMLRDLKAYFGATPVQLENVSGFTWEFVNNLSDDAEDNYAAGRNVVTSTYNGVKRRVWFPYRHALRAAQGVSGSITFSEPDYAQEVQHDLLIADKLVAEITAGDLATTPAAKETMRITMYNRVLTEGGLGALSKSDRIDTEYTFGAFFSETDQKDVEVEFLDASNVVIP